jgi:erythromycin esterase
MSSVGSWRTPIRDQLEWLRQHNSMATHPVGYYGIDMPGSMASPLPGLDAVLAYLADADPEFTPDPGIRATAAAFAAPSAFAGPAAVSGYRSTPPEARDALTAGLADLVARMAARRLEYLRLTTVDAYRRAFRSLAVTVTLDAMFRDLTRGDQRGMMLDRDATIADTVEWILCGEDRIVLAAHNGHVQRWPGTVRGLPPVTTMGMHLADRLGGAYLVIGTTSGTGQTLNTAPDFYAGTLFTHLDPPRPGSLDALLAASHDGPFATDLRRLSPTDTAVVAAVTEQRYGTSYVNMNPLAAFDIVVHLPHVSAAEIDDDAISYASDDVRDALAAWHATTCR